MARILDIIEYIDEGRDEIVHRIPERGSGDFRIGSQLIVRESQAAVFFRDGKALDTFGAGRHTITTANIPGLVNLVGKAFSGQTPFHLTRKALRGEPKAGQNLLPQDEVHFGLAALEAGSHVVDCGQRHYRLAKPLRGLFQNIEVVAVDFHLNGRIVRPDQALNCGFVQAIAHAQFRNTAQGAIDQIHDLASAKPAVIGQQHRQGRSVGPRRVTGSEDACRVGAHE